jgi:hypothetical protein
MSTALFLTTYKFTLYYHGTGWSIWPDITMFYWHHNVLCTQKEHL